MLVDMLVLVAGVRITRRTGHIPLQGAPEDLTPAKIRTELLDQVDGISDIQNVHVWPLTEDKPVVTLCIIAEEEYCVEELLVAVKHCLTEQMHVHLTTVEITVEQEYPPLSVVPDPMQMTGSF